MKPRKNKLHVWLHDCAFGKETWHWHLKSAYNGKIICAGEPNGYSSKAKALAGWNCVAKSAQNGVELHSSAGR